MNCIQGLIDRQLGIYCRLNYDSILRRLVVEEGESFYGLQGIGGVAHFEQDPPIFACRFAESAGMEHVLALANEDGRVAIQDTSTASSARSLESFQCHNNAVFDLAWMPRNMNFVTVSGDHTACLWDAGEGAARRVASFSHHSRSVKCAVFRPAEPRAFATGARDGHVLVWDIRAPQLPALRLKPDNCLLSCHSATAPKTPGSHGKRPRLDHRAISITGLAFQDDVTLISCGECDGNIKVWDLRKNYSIYKREPLPKHSIPYSGSSTRNGYTNLIVDESGVRLYASCMDNVIYCFNVSTYSATPERRYVGHENATFYIKTGLSPDGMYLVSGSSDKNAYIWNVKCSEPVVKLSGHWAEVTCAAWCARGPAKVVTCSDDARHKIWRIGPETLDRDLRYQGTAEEVPRTDITSLPKWGSLERTPSSLKRRSSTTPTSAAAKRGRAHTPSLSSSPSANKTKRCLADIMNATRHDDDTISAKRIKLDLALIQEEDQLLPAGIKRHLSETSPTKRADNSDWGYIPPKAGSSFMTPTKSYETRNCKLLSPKGLKVSPNRMYRSPEETSPKVRIISFRTPTKDLPNFVLSGEAPHLRLMSPVKKKQERPNWLTQLGREKRGRNENEKPPEKPASEKTGEGLVPFSPKENIPARRSSVSDRTPKASYKSGSLLKYFTVTTKK